LAIFYWYIDFKKEFDGFGNGKSSCVHSGVDLVFRGKASKT
jgi:hypothetical protein